MLISVIIPVYNAENYLRSTISSVINQTLGFNNIELILVDDNSTDGSKEIIEEYSNKYDNIVCHYSEVNHGFPGFGRNMGVNIATSEYIMFLDNDDEYDNDICKNLYEAIVENNADMASCGRVFVDELGEQKDSYIWEGGKDYEDYVIFENEEVLSLDSITIWNKIFKKKIIDDAKLKFIEFSGADDFAFSVDYYSNCKKVVHLKNYYGYLWNIRGESLSHDVKIKSIDEELKTYNYMISKNENEIKSSNVFFRHMMSLLLSKCSYLDANFNEFKSVLNKIYDFEKKVDVDVKLNVMSMYIPNKMILHKNFFLATIYFKTFRRLRKSTFLVKIVRMLN